MNFLLEKQPETVWIVGSGWEGSFSLEDTVCAGAIAHSICQQTNFSLTEINYIYHLDYPICFLQPAQ